MKQLVIVLAGLGVIFLMGCSGMGSPVTGFKGGKLLPCPGKPNCVTSVQQEAEHFIEPFHYTGTPAEAVQTLKTIVLAHKNTQILDETDVYLHATFTSTVFRFVDDVEFLVDSDQNRIDIRSASRLGYSDMGVNRKRLETIRKEFNAKTDQ